MNEHRHLSRATIAPRWNRIAVVLSCVAGVCLGAWRVRLASAGAVAPCCRVATIDQHTGLVHARVNATGQPFVFFVKDSATRQSLKVGQDVYANFSSRRASLDGRTACCAILALAKVNPRARGMAPRVARRTPDLRPREAAMPAGFILSPSASLGGAGNPGVVVPADWSRRAPIQVRPGGRYTIISAAQYRALAGGRMRGAVPGVSPLERLLQQGRGNSFDGYYLVDATASGESRRLHPLPPLGGRGGGGGSGPGGTGGTGGTPGSNDPGTFIAKYAQPGDIVFASHPVINPDTFGEFNHAAMVIAPDWGKGCPIGPCGGDSLLAEETAYNPGTDKPGARLVFWSDFIDPSRNYNKVALGRVQGLSQQQTQDVIDWAISRLGRPYRWPTDVGAKDDDNRMYCSQYVWIDYLRNTGLDLDSDGGYFVFPDDIYYDQYVQHIGEVDLP